MLLGLVGNLERVVSIQLTPHEKNYEVSRCRLYVCLRILGSHFHNVFILGMSIHGHFVGFIFLSELRV